MESRFNGLYFGTIQEVIKPGDKNSQSKFQYEYKVLATCDNYSQIPVRAICLDPFGGLNEYEDKPLSVGNRVFLMFPRGDTHLAIIFGGSRLFQKKTDPDLGDHWARRKNEIVELIDKKGAWSVTSLKGPFIKVEKDKITIDNDSGESIEIDKTMKKMTIKAQKMQITVKGDCTIEALGKTVIEGSQIKLGDGASEAVIKGDTFKQWAETHTHPSAMGPTGPSIQPVPPSSLSKKVKVE